MAEVEVEGVPGSVADELVRFLSVCERQVAALRVALTRTVTGTGAHLLHGGRDPVTYLAQVAGTSRGTARAELELAERLAELPALEAAVRRGQISVAQARVIAPAAAVAPEAAGDLVAAAGVDSMVQLRALATRTERAARGEAAQQDAEGRVRARRYCRTWVPDAGGVRLEAWLPAIEGGTLLAALEKKTAGLLRASDEAPERVRADALVALVAGARVLTELAVRVDAAALVRGEVEGGESCEIPGVGPVSVRAARSLLGESFLTLLVTQGQDIRTVTSTTRVLPRKVHKALAERDRTCVVPGCGASFFLQSDHWRLDFSKWGPTELDNLCRLCSVHHRQKTDGIIVLGGGPGRWRVRPGPRAARAGAYAAAARARAQSRAGPPRAVP